MRTRLRRIPDRAGTGAILDRVTGRPPLRSATPGPPPAPRDTWATPDGAPPRESTALSVPETTRSVETPTAGDAVAPSPPAAPPPGFDPFPNDPSALTVMRDAVARRFRLVRAWSQRPAGRFLVPTLVIAVVLAVTGTAGLYLTPAVSPLPRASAADPPTPSAAPHL